MLARTLELLMKKPEATRVQPFQQYPQQAFSMPGMVPTSPGYTTYSGIVPMVPPQQARTSFTSFLPMPPGNQGQGQEALFVRRSQPGLSGSGMGEIMAMEDMVSDDSRPVREPALHQAPTPPAPPPPPEMAVQRMFTSSKAGRAPAYPSPSAPTLMLNSLGLRYRRAARRDKMTPPLPPLATSSPAVGTADSLIVAHASSASPGPYSSVGRHYTPPRRSTSFAFSDSEVEVAGHDEVELDHRGRPTMLQRIRSVKEERRKHAPTAARALTSSLAVTTLVAFDAAAEASEHQSQDMQILEHEQHQQQQRLQQVQQMQVKRNSYRQYHDDGVPLPSNVASPRTRRASLHECILTSALWMPPNAPSPSGSPDGSSVSLVAISPPQTSNHARCNLVPSPHLTHNIKEIPPRRRVLPHASESGEGASSTGPLLQRPAEQPGMDLIFEQISRRTASASAPGWIELKREQRRHSMGARVLHQHLFRPDAVPVAEGLNDMRDMLAMRGGRNVRQSRWSNFQPANYCTEAARNAWWCRFGFLVDDVVGTEPQVQEIQCRENALIANAIAFFCVAIAAILLAAWAAFDKSWPQVSVLMALRTLWLLYVIIVRPYVSSIATVIEVGLSGGSIFLLACAMVQLSGAS
eukprot:gene14759-20810_t